MLNWPGGADFAASVAITSAGLNDGLDTWIDETQSDPIQALDKGSLCRLTTSIHSKTGSRVDAMRVIRHPRLGRRQRQQLR